MDSSGKTLSFFEVGCRSLAPDKIAVWSIGKSPRNGRIQAALHPVKTFWCALSSKKFLVSRINVTGDKMRTVSISASNEKSRYTHNISSQASSDQVFDSSLCWYEYFAAHVPAFLLGR